MKKNRTNAFDWTLIQWARACEEEKLFDASKIDRELELERDKSGRLIDPELCFSQRARRVLDSLGLSGRRQYDHAVFIQIFTCCLVVVLGACVFPMARVQRLLGDEVNLAGPFFFFVVGQIFFLSASLILSCVLVVQALVRRLRGKTRPKTFGEKLVESLSNVVGEIVLFILRKQISTSRSLKKDRPLASLFSRKRVPQESNPDDARKDALELKGRALFWDVVFSRPRFLFFWGGTLSQLFWTSCSFCVLIILGMHMQSERYDYRWKTSLESREAVMNVVKALEPSVSWLGFAPLTERDVESLFEEDVPERPTISAAQRDVRRATQKEGERARWSYFLLGVVFVWCVLPRAFLCAFNYSFYRFSLCDFRPKLNEPYFKKIRENIELRSSRTESQYVPEVNEPVAAPPLDSSDKKTTVYDEIVAGSKLPQTTIKRETPQIIAVEPSNSQESPVRASSDAFTAESAAPTLEEATQENAIVPLPASEETATYDEKLPPAPKEKQEEVSVDVKEEAQPIQKAAETPKESPTPRPTTTTSRPRSSKARISKSAVVALGYDASLRDEQWRNLTSKNACVSIFGDVADDPATKKRLRALLQERGESIALCAFVTDVSLPPARHLTRFLRDVLIPGAPNAQIVVVLSGGERLRRKFDGNANAVSERLTDWRRTLEALAEETGAEITPTFFYDAELDLPEQRAKLRNLLCGNTTGSESQTNETKRTTAAETIYRECLEIFESSDYSPSEEESRLRVSNLCSQIFEIYRAEVEQTSSCGVKFLESTDANGSILSRLSAAAKFGGETLVHGGTALSEAITNASLEKGLDLHSVEQGLTFACGLSARARELCRKLSPKCAIALGSVGLAAPVVVALAPVLGGTLSLSAIATSVAALGSALPSTLVGGALGGALGALTPLSLGACKKKLLEKLVGAKGKKEQSASDALSSSEKDGEATNYDSEKIADVATALCSASSWLAVLDLQRKDEEQIVELLPLVLEPVEESTFETPEEVRKALDAVVENLQNI